MKVTIEGTPEEIAEWARKVAGAPQYAPCLLPHYPQPQTAPISWPQTPPIYPLTPYTWTWSISDVLHDGARSNEGIRNGQ